MGRRAGTRSRTLLILCSVAGLGCGKRESPAGNRVVRIRIVPGRDYLTQERDKIAAKAHAARTRSLG
jgi:hypothetical protein